MDRWLLRSCAVDRSLALSVGLLASYEAAVGLRKFSHFIYTLTINSLTFTIKTASVLDVYNLSKGIPEFQIKPYSFEKYQKYLSRPSAHALIAYDGDKGVGFKGGYDSFKDGSFYSWIGGVLPEYRRHGIAQLLMDEQLKWAKEQGYKSVKYKTQNRFRGMLLLGIKNGYQIIDFKPNEEKPSWSNILLEKRL